MTKYPFPTDRALSTDTKDRFYANSDEEILTDVFGGDCATILHNYDGVEFACGGVCRQNIKIRLPFIELDKPVTHLYENRYRLAPIVGYPHDGGIKDENGHKWWLYVHCPAQNCGYDTAIWKVNNLRKQAEHQIQVDKEEAEFQSVDFTK